MKRPLSLVLTLIAAFAVVSEVLALDGSRAAYAGGTLELFDNLRARVEGRLDLTDPSALVFVAGDASQRTTSLRIPYASIRDLEFGQRVRRRIGAAAVSTAVLGPIGVLALTAKKREHYLTVVYTDPRGLHQAVIFELGKDVVRSTLSAIEARSRLTIEYQDEHARAWR